MLETRKLQFQTIISFVMIEIDMVEASSFMLRRATSLQCCLVPPLIWKSLLFVYKVEIVKLAFHFFIDLPVLLQLFLSHSILPSILILFCLEILNVNFVSSSHPLYSKLCNIMSTYCLTQIVTEYTHVHHNGSTSIIDLVFLSNPASLLSCVTVPPLLNSDHNGLLTTMKWKGTGSGVHSSRRLIWRYAYADWEKACELIDNTNWDSLCSDDINLSWSNWQLTAVYEYNRGLYT